MELTKLSTMMDLMSWIKVKENLIQTTNAFLDVSQKDKRRLRSLAFTDADSVWGKLATTLFNKNQPLQRFFLFIVWDDNKENIKVIHKKTLLNFNK